MTAEDNDSTEVDEQIDKVLNCIITEVDEQIDEVLNRIIPAPYQNIVFAHTCVGEQLICEYENSEPK